FQAEDGIRDFHVTGVQTCALPIWLQLTGLDRLAQNNAASADGLLDFIDGITIDNARGKLIFPVVEPFGKDLEAKFSTTELDLKEIGRASCREREYITTIG